jgi:hypothetical protein
MTSRTAAKPKPSPDEYSFQGEVRTVMAALQHAIRAALGDDDRGDTRAPAELSRDLGLDTKLGWKLHWMLSNADPFAAALFVPGRAGIGLFVEGLRRAGASPARLKEVEQAGEAFHRCVTRHAENRAGFDTLLGAHTSDDRANVEHRKLAYQGARSIWGIESRCNMLTYIVHPSADGESMDIASVRGIIGCQRLREHVPWRVGRTVMRKPDSGVSSAFRREPVDPALRGMQPGDELPVLRAYCTDPLPPIDRVPGPHGAVEFQLGAGPVGKRGRFDLITGEVVRSMQQRYAEPGDPPLRMRFGVRIPTQLAVFDVLMHREMFARSAPRVLMLSDLFASELGSQHQPADELPGAPPLEVLRASPEQTGLEDAPQFADAIDESLATLGWGPEGFDVFRVKMPYPPVPTTMVMEFDSSAARRG